MFKSVLTHPIWWALGLLLALIEVCKLLHPGIETPWQPLRSL